MSVRYKITSSLVRSRCCYNFFSIPIFFKIFKSSIIVLLMLMRCQVAKTCFLSAHPYNSILKALLFIKKCWLVYLFWWFQMASFVLKVAIDRRQFCLLIFNEFEQKHWLLYPWSNEKTFGFLKVSGEIEVN